MKSPRAVVGGTQRRGFQALGRNKLPCQLVWVYSQEDLERFSVGDKQLSVQAAVLRPFLSALRWERSQPVHLMFE